MKLSLSLESVENIEEVKMSFSAKFNLQLQWFDKRLDWMNLKNEKHLNLLRGVITILNAKTMIYAKFDSFQLSIFKWPIRNFFLSPLPYKKKKN